MTVFESNQADRVLADRIRSGDAEALETIVQRHWVPILAYSKRIVRAADVAEEVVQETFVRLWENRTRLRRGEALKAYLFRTARNLSLGEIRHLRVRRRAEPRMRLALQRPAPSALDALEDQQLQEALKAAIEKLPPRRREAFVLVRVEGLTLLNVAERMGLTRQTVANHISLALRDLEEDLRPFSE